MKKLSQAEGSTADIVTGNVEEMKKIFPEVFSENGVNFDVLRQLLGDAKVLDEGEEKYGLNWHGKKKARQIALTPSTGTLRPCPDDSVDWDKTQNLFIEGDNLEVLKLLQRSYANKVKMIYIDPPYNTGKEFIYPDNYQDNLDTYLRYTKQKGEDGFRLTSNTESSGRKHTNWLNMMYPRLKLAKTLLKREGIIFISIDENEYSNIKKLCDEIFGEENQLIPFIWELPRGINAGHISKSHEYVIAYAKSKNHLRQFFRNGEADYSVDRCNKKIDARHPASEITFPAGIKYEGKDQVLTGKINGSEEIYITGELCFKDGALQKPVTLKAGWTMKDMILKWLNGEEVVDTKGQKIVEFFFKENGKLYSKKAAEFQSAKSVIKSVGDYQDARIELETYFGSQDIFEYPKPTKLIQYLASLTTENDDIILDFFAGSCPTADAVYKLNVLDNGNRKYIAVQLPEEIKETSAEAFSQGFKKISDLGLERIRRAAKKIKDENPKYQGDLGFKIFKLDSSNIRAWNPDAADLEKTLLDNAEHLVEGRSDEDVLYELLLKRGVDLTVAIESKKIAGKSVYSIGHGVLFACLATSIKRQEIEELASGIIEWFEKLKPATETHVFFRDSAFADDVTKTNLSAILGQHGITHVRSL